MEYDDDLPRDLPTRRERLAAFHGQIATLLSPPHGVSPAISVESTNDAPWSVTLTYQDGKDTLITVRTIRRPDSYPEREWPDDVLEDVEDLTSAILNHRFAVEGMADSPAANWRFRGSSTKNIGAVRAVRAEIGARPTAVGIVVVDGQRLTGRSVDFEDLVGVTVNVAGQQIFIVARRGQDAELRMVTGHDLLANDPTAV